MPTNHFPADAFGDRFDVSSLPLPRAPAGYAVQRLDTDQLLDRYSNELHPVRTTDLNPIFDSFDEAFRAASQWVSAHGADPRDHHLAIVPVGYDTVFQRPVLIYGVLCAQP